MQKLDSITVAEFLDERAFTASAKALITILVRSLLTAEPKEISMLFWLYFVHSGGGVLRLTETTKGAQEQKFRGGAQLISDRLASTLISKGVDVRLGCPVQRIDQTSGDHVAVHCRDGSILRCKRVVCAFPPALLPKVRDRD